MFSSRSGKAKPGEAPASSASYSAGEGERAGRRFGRVGDQDQRLDRGRAGPGSACSSGRKSRIDEHDLGPGVVERVDDLLGREPPVHGLQRGAHAGDGEEALEVAVAVELHHRHDVAGLDPQAGEPVGEPADAAAEIAIAVTEPVAIDDFLVRRGGQRRQQQLLDEQRVAVCGRRDCDWIAEHAALPSHRDRPGACRAASSP